MSEEKQSFWDLLFGGFSHNAQEDKMLQYLITARKPGRTRRIRFGKITCAGTSPSSDKIVGDPKLVVVARNHLERVFESGGANSEPMSK